jgi:hypothetical protein
MDKGTKGKGGIAIIISMGKKPAVIKKKNKATTKKKKA